MGEDTPKIELVFGASGYIGSNLVEFLAAEGRIIRASSRNREVLEGRGWEGVELVRADALQPDSLDAALRGIDLEVEEADFFSLLGPNGAGKSTAIGIVSSLVNKSAGQVRVFGHDLDHAPSAVKSCIGLVPQEFNFNQFEPVVEIVVNQAGYYGIPRDVALQRAEKYLNKLQLWDKAHKWSRTLSGGMKRRLMIARAMVNEPRLLILDEPTAGVDIEIRRSMWEFIREINDEGTTVILTTHYLEEAESLCRNIAIIDHGVIVRKGRPAELKAEVGCPTLFVDVDGAANEQATPLLAAVSFAVAGPSTAVYNTSANCGVVPDQLDQLLHSQFVPAAKEAAEVIAEGVNASPGAAVGWMLNFIGSGDHFSSTPLYCERCTS